jgi:hypothetical protein
MNRFENAALKLYNAFNKGELNAMDTCACAVGNLCNNEDFWTGSNYKPFKTKNITGYDMEEIKNIENLFMFGERDINKRALWNAQSMTKENQYNALMAVLEYLSELDNIKFPLLTVDDFKRVLQNNN